MASLPANEIREQQLEEWCKAIEQRVIASLRAAPSYSMMLIREDLDAALRGMFTPDNPMNPDKLNG